MRRQLSRAGPNETPQVPNIKNSTCKMKLAQLDAMLAGCGGRVAICYRGLLSLVFRAAGWVSLVFPCRLASHPPLREQQFDSFFLKRYLRWHRSCYRKLGGLRHHPLLQVGTQGHNRGRNFARAGSHEGLALIYTAILYGHDKHTEDLKMCDRQR
jgi:hypothetical protein